jgi:hypothetical protein
VGVEITDLAGDSDTAFAEGWQIQDGGGDSDRFPFLCIVEAHAGKIVRLTEYLDSSRFREPEARELAGPPRRDAA